MRAAFYTLGCKVNQYETEALRQQFAGAGYDIVEPDTEAEVYIVNSCTVTAMGDKKSRQLLRRLKRCNPTAVVCLTGCFPQAFPDIAAAIPEADVITGSKNRAGLLGAVSQRLRGGARVVDICPHGKDDPFEALSGTAPLTPEQSIHTRAFVKIEDGCDRRCAYCIIPTARGPVRSKPLEVLREELFALAASGYKEVVLAGINLSSYGRDLGLRLPDALAVACATAGITRVRMGSLEPELLCAEDLLAMRSMPGICPQFHLALQSGCDETLRRMRRRYNTAGYRRLVEALRSAFPGCAITTDLMVGFPGETKEEFRQSLAFAQSVGFAKAHVFAYSLRPGTLAAELPGQVPAAEKSRRAKEMADMAQESRSAFLREQVGSTAAVLVEHSGTPGRWGGYSENYTPVVVHGAQPPVGTLCAVSIADVGLVDGEACCLGRLCTAPPSPLT